MCQGLDPSTFSLRCPLVMPVDGMDECARGVFLRAKRAKVSFSLKPRRTALLDRKYLLLATEKIAGAPFHTLCLLDQRCTRPLPRPRQSREPHTRPVAMGQPP